MGYSIDPSDTGDRDRLRALLAALERPATARELADDDRVFRVARHHRLSPLLSIVCDGTLPARLSDRFRRDRLVTAARNLLLANAAEEIIQALATRGVPAAILKGLDYERRLYTGPGTRPTADVDLLVAAEHRRLAFRVLDEAGYEPRAAAPGFDNADYHEVAWTRSGVEIDLHLRLAPPARCRIDYASLWRATEPAAFGKAEARVLRIDHAVIFHALHMAIDHFDVPAIYLVDMARLVSSVSDFDGLMRLASEWRCRRALATTLALTGAFLPEWREAHPLVRGIQGSAEVVEGYGGMAQLSRPRQLRRKVLHFDYAPDVVRYVALQSVRNLREQLERRVRKRTARERLAL